jgi:hypothetical protein
VADLFGAPLGIVASQENNRQAITSGLGNLKMLGDIAQQPAELQVKQAQARVLQADAAGKEAEAAAQQRMLELQQEFIQGARAAGKEATVEDLEPGTGKPKSQASQLEAFANFADKKGMPPMALAKVREEIAKIYEHEAITGYRSQQAMQIEEKRALEHMGRVSNISAAAAASPQDYALALMNPETRKLLPPGLTGDYATDRPVLEMITRAGQDSIKAADLARKQADSVQARLRSKAAAAASNAAANASTERVNLTKKVSIAIDKNGGEKSQEAKDAKVAATDAKLQETQAKLRKEFPPLILDPESREPNKMYMLADGRVARWEMNPATGKMGLNVLDTAKGPSALTRSLINGNDPAKADAATADDMED